METFALETDHSWADSTESIQKLASLLRSGVSHQDCALIFQTTADSVAYIVANNPSVRAALIENLDNTRYTLKRKAVTKADKVLDIMYNIADDEEAAARDRIAAGKVVLEVAGVTGATATASEKRMTENVEALADGDTTAQDTLNRLINHFIDARQAEMQNG